MATKQSAAELRRCVGSKSYGIAPHDAPIAEFPVQPSRKDGLGVMCKKHWSEYTSALRKEAAARKAAAAASAPADAPLGEGEAAPKPKRASKAKASAAQDLPTHAEAEPKPSRRNTRTPDSASDVPPSVESFIDRNGGSLPIEPRAGDGGELPTG